jgi:hypothetical protein
MIYRQLINGDYSFGSGMADFYVNQPEAVAQAAQTRLLLSQGEWFLDDTYGTPYMQGILGKYTLDTVDQLIAHVILETEGVTAIQSLQSEYNGADRSLQVYAVIDTEYGTADVYGAF